jgi:trk system potassium uptake protein TrkH
MQGGSWKPKPGDRIVRHPREEQISPVRFEITTLRAQSRTLASPIVLLYSFMGFIMAGTLLLLLPFTSQAGGFTPFVDALFTATSAVTVTGLVIQDTATYWTPTGQAIILALIFIGGLSFMAIATFLLILIGRRLSLGQRMLARDSYQVNQLGGLARLTVKIVLVAAAVQIAGFVALAVRFSLLSDLEGQPIWQALFQSVSAFNSAGFVNLPEGESLSAFRTDKIVLGIMGLLIFLGAISYFVMVDVARLRRFSLFSFNTKIVLILTAALTLSGALVFFTSETDNPNTIGNLSIADKIMVSVFESTSGRTAGFSTVSYDETAQHTNFFFTALMFIGGASASVAGGIKINTLGVVLIAVLSTLGGRAHTRAFGREIPHVQVQRATAIAVMALIVVFLFALVLTFSEPEFAFIDLLFETVSAFGTVGLSTGLTPDLSQGGHLILIVAMFLGRVGPFTLGLMMAERGENDLYRYAQERVTIA